MQGIHGGIFGEDGEPSAQLFFNRAKKMKRITSCVTLKERSRVGSFFPDSYRFLAVKLRIVLGCVSTPQDSVFFVVNFEFTFLKPSSIPDMLFARWGYLLHFFGGEGDQLRDTLFCKD